MFRLMAQSGSASQIGWPHTTLGGSSPVGIAILGNKLYRCIPALPTVSNTPDELQQLIWGGLNDIWVQTSHQELVCNGQRSQGPHMSSKHSFGFFLYLRHSFSTFTSPLPPQPAHITACNSSGLSFTSSLPLACLTISSGLFFHLDASLPPPLPSQSAQVSLIWDFFSLNPSFLPPECSRRRLPGWQQTGDSRCICASSPWVLIFYYKMTKEEQGSRCICVSSPRYVFFFFLLSFFLLLTNNLCLVHFYRNHDDHDNDWPPSSWLKWGTGQGTTRAQDTTCLEPLVCFSFFLFQNFNSFFFTKCLSFKRSTNGHYHHHQWKKCGLKTQMRLKFQYVIFFLSFFLY